MSVSRVAVDDDLPSPIATMSTPIAAKSALKLSVLNLQHDGHAVFKAAFPLADAPPAPVPLGAPLFCEVGVDIDEDVDVGALGDEVGELFGDPLDEHAESAIDPARIAVPIIQRFIFSFIISDI